MSNESEYEVRGVVSPPQALRPLRSPSCLTYRLDKAMRFLYQTILAVNLFFAITVAVAAPAPALGPGSVDDPDEGSQWGRAWFPQNS